MLILEDYKIYGKTIKVVRDDIYPFIGGGNKARKAEVYQKYLQEGGYNAVVTTGGIQSNHCRAVALMAAKNGWKCHLVYHGNRERFEKEKGNALLVRLSRASVEFVEAENIGPSMDAAIERFKKDGYNPYYITGGGHDLPGGIAFVEAVKELKEMCELSGYKPDCIYLASGTGSTQAGIVVGLDLLGWGDVKVVGISVARQKERGIYVIKEFAQKLVDSYGFKKMYQEADFNFNTDFLCGGYEGYTEDMKQFIESVTPQTGLVFDTTYSGKALWGMMKLINPDEKALFWHTGGIMNLQK